MGLLPTVIFQNTSPLLCSHIFGSARLPTFFLNDAAAEPSPRSNYQSHLPQRFSAQPLATLGQIHALCVGQTESPFDLVPEDAIFGGQMLVAKE